MKIHYAGDLDPEGLLIAQKIRQYYGECVSFWHMTPDDYQNSRSDEIISARRMKMLDRITDEELRPTADAIREGGTAGYQEKIFARIGDEP